MSYRALGEDEPQLGPPPAGKPKYMLMVGWGVVMTLTAGIFWAAATGAGTKPVNANRRR